MFRFVAALVLSILATVALPAAALGKGASEATVSGPGLEGPIALAGEGDPNGQLLMTIADAGGFFPAVFAQTPDPMRAERPAGTLGPKYTVAYVMPGPSGEEDTLVQEVFPYASPSPVTYVQPGQRFWTTEATRGGWYVASAYLRDLLVQAGLPETAPTSGVEPSDSPWTVIGAVGVLVLVVAATAIAALLSTRRNQTRTVTASRSAS
jgi:hypothetical protein